MLRFDLGSRKPFLINPDPERCITNLLLAPTVNFCQHQSLVRLQPPERRPHLCLKLFDVPCDFGHPRVVFYYVYISIAGRTVLQHHFYGVPVIFALEVVKHLCVPWADAVVQKALN